jgi:hypothetical protein
MDAANELFHTHETFGSAMGPLARVEETIQRFDMPGVNIATGDELVR